LNVPSNRLSIRSYSTQVRSHFHLYHQLVLPIQGTISIKVGNYNGLVNVGDCVIIKAGEIHTFTANESARFLVVDSEVLPNNLMRSPKQKVSIDKALLSFIQFVDTQLIQQVNESLESKTFELLFTLLEQQTLSLNVDKRIEKVISLINTDLSQPLHINELAKVAHLSETQFKKVFRESTGQSCTKYITQLRMEKARALLTHTDTPINIIAEQCGYQSPSAFSRRFKTFFNSTPRGC